MSAMAEAADVGPHDRCAHAQQELRRREDAIGRPRYVRQCLDCGETLGTSIAAAVALSGGFSPAPFNEELVERCRAETRAFYEAKRANWQGRQEAKSRAWWERYNAYLASPEWRVKRAQALKRDGGVCQGCHRRPATQVHHLSYAHVGNELLFELVSICDDCHGRAHEAAK